jgi:hypothetical protein
VLLLLVTVLNAGCHVSVGFALALEAPLIS